MLQGGLLQLIGQGKTLHSSLVETKCPRFLYLADGLRFQASRLPGVPTFHELRGLLSYLLIVQ